MNLNRIKELHDSAIKMQPFPDPRWPPSIYYRFLGLVARDMEAKYFVELGTCGGGASYNVAKISPKTIVYSIDVVKLEQVNAIELLCPNFNFIIGDSIKTAKELGPKLDVPSLLFIDTIHTYEHTKAEFEAWLLYLKPGSVVCFDDLHRSGMDRFWNELTYTKSEFDELRLLHLAGAPDDGGFGCVLLN